jgi:hypothetical protein
MNKIAISLFFVTALSYGMEEGHSLVVGSTGESGIKKVFPVQLLWKEDKADLSHINTYGGKATTMDTQKSYMPNVKHIVGDASVYQFGKNTISAVYLERLPTSSVCQTDKGLRLDGIEKNYLGQCIQNIGSAMKSGGEIEIEWHPYMALYQENPEDIKPLYDKKLIKQNPFTTNIDVNVALSGVKMAYLSKLSFDVKVPELFIDRAKALSVKIKQLLCFYEKEKVGKKALLENRLDQEILLFKQFIKSNDKAILSCGPGASLEEFSRSIEHIHFISMSDLSKIGTSLVIEKDGKSFSGRLYDSSCFLGESFLNFILCDASIEYNGMYVKQFMKKNGFKDVTIKRTTSLRNGRKNVWIVKGTKA